MIRLIGIGSAAGALGSVVGACVFLWWTGLLGVQPAVTLFGSIVALVLGLLGIFREPIRDMYHGPELSLCFDPNRDDAHETEDVEKAALVGKVRIPIAYIRLRVANIGQISATNVEVVVRSVTRRDDSWKALEGIVPGINLAWSYTGDAYMTQIPSGVERYVDLIKLKDPRYDEGGQKGHFTPAGKPRLCYKTTSHKHLGDLPNGAAYRVELVIAAANASSRTFQFDLTLPDNWYEGGSGDLTAQRVSLVGLPSTVL